MAKSIARGDFLGRYGVPSLRVLQHLNPPIPSSLSLRQGGFAKCYELIDLATNVVYAGKIVPKSLLTKPHQRDKVSPVSTLTSSLP